MEELFGDLATFGPSFEDLRLSGLVLEVESSGSHHPVDSIHQGLCGFSEV